VVVTSLWVPAKICDFNVAKAALLGAVLEIGKIGR